MFPTLLLLDGCGACPADNRRLNLKKYCKRDYGNYASFTSYYESIQDEFVLLRVGYILM